MYLLVLRSLHRRRTSDPDRNSNILHCPRLPVHCGSILFHPEILFANIEAAAFHGPRGQKPSIVSPTQAIPKGYSEAHCSRSTQFIESLSGLATIRAFGWQQDERDLNLRLLDTSQKPFYLLFMIQQWLTLVLDLVSMGLALIVTGLAVKLRDVVSPGFTGLALVQIIGFNIMLQSLVIWCESQYRWYSGFGNIADGSVLGTLLETSIGAVSRVKTFATDTQSEALPAEIVLPPEDWPARGLIEFRGVSASYK